MTKVPVEGSLNGHFVLRGRTGARMTIVLWASGSTRFASQNYRSANSYRSCSSSVNDDDF
jgi:hypothetical protein